MSKRYKERRSTQLVRTEHLNCEIERGNVTASFNNLRTYEFQNQSLFFFFGDSGAINYNRNELLRAQNKESIKICQSECENKIL